MNLKVNSGVKLMCVCEITDKFEQRVQAEMSTRLTIPFGAQINAGGEREKIFSSKSRAEQAERFQSIVKHNCRLAKSLAANSKCSHQGF